MIKKAFQYGLIFLAMATIYFAAAGFTKSLMSGQKYDKATMRAILAQRDSLIASMSNEKYNVSQVCYAVRNLDTSRCSPHFRAIYLEYLNALGEWEILYNQVPHSVLDGFNKGLKNFFTRGEIDGGLIRMQNGSDALNKRLSDIDNRLIMAADE